MSAPEEFNKLPISAKTVILSLIILIPFWLVAIYLLNRPLYNSGDYIIIGAFCLCFSTTWLFISILLAAGASKLDNRDRDLATQTLVGGIISVLYLSGIIILSYYFKFSFLTFLIISYSYLIFVLIKIALRLRIKRLEKRLKRKEELKKQLNDIKNL